MYIVMLKRKNRKTGEIKAEPYSNHPYYSIFAAYDEADEARENAEDNYNHYYDDVIGVFVKEIEEV